MPTKPNMPNYEAAPRVSPTRSSSNAGLFQGLRDRLHTGDRLSPSRSSAILAFADSFGLSSLVPVKKSKVADLTSGRNTTIHFSQSTLVFALDASGSTAGKIIQVEKSVIKIICGRLTAARRLNTLILPWDNHARRAIQLDELDHVDSLGGTDPTVLLADPVCSNALSRSDLWFLLTDGEIQKDTVRKFALGIGAAGLHGTACVLIVFGSSLERPILCNVSVGISVFAITPDCLFLFHDFESGQIYVLQSKGCFNALIPDDKRELQITNTTRWDDLHRFKYEGLVDFQIPVPRKPGQDTVLLSNGDALDLNDIYNNTLNESVTRELFARHEDLDTLVLTAHTRGREDDVRKWISEQRIKTPDPIWAERPDEHEIGASLTQALVRELRSSFNRSASGSQEFVNAHVRGGSEAEVQRLKSELRACHKRNWRNFISELGIDTLTKAERDMIIDIARGTLRPEVFPPGAVRTMSTPIKSALKSKLISRREQASSSKPHTSSSDRIENKDSSCLLYLKGFQATRELGDRNKSQEDCYGTCDLCGETNMLLCLLTRNSPEGLTTQGFPAAGSSSKHKYPLVLGNYPETDVIAPLACCDACSYFLVQHGESPQGDKLIAALPLVSLENNINRKSYVEALTKTYENRFHSTILFQVLLSSIWSTVDYLTSLDSREVDATISALKATSRHLSHLPIELPSSTMLPTSIPPVGIDPSEPLDKILSKTLVDFKTTGCPLLFYPLDGFVVLAKTGSSLTQISGDSDDGAFEKKLTSFTWLRTLYHLTEKHYLLKNASSAEDASQELLGILSEHQAQHDSEDSTGEISISITSLDGTYLLSRDSGELATFQRLGDHFLTIQAHCGTAIAAFLRTLRVTAHEFATPEQCFNAMKVNENLRQIFWAIEEMNEARI